MKQGAPQRHVEVVGRGCEIPVQTRVAPGLDLRFEVFHAIRRHPEGKVIFANVEGLQMPGLKPGNQFPRIGGQHARPFGGEEVGRLCPT